MYIIENTVPKLDVAMMDVFSWIGLNASTKFWDNEFLGPINAVMR